MATLTEQQKQFILSVLQKDSVPITDSVSETCADIYADMLVSGALETKEGREDDLTLDNLKKEFFLLVREKKFDSVFPVLEKIHTLKEQYHAIRFGDA